MSNSKMVISYSSSSTRHSSGSVSNSFSTNALRSLSPKKLILQKKTRSFAFRASQEYVSTRTRPQRTCAVSCNYSSSRSGFFCSARNLSTTCQTISRSHHFSHLHNSSRTSLRTVRGSKAERMGPRRPQQATLGSRMFAVKIRQILLQDNTLPLQALAIATNSTSQALQSMLEDP